METEKTIFESTIVNYTSKGITSFMADLTSEKIAKALKGAGLNSKQRIEKAREAWNNVDIFFPNKDDFLFDWICSTFAKPNMKKLDDCCLLQLPYWQLLVDLLLHYLEQTQLDAKRSVPTIHINFVSCVSTLLQQLYKLDLFQLDERVAFLAISHQCLDILLSDSFALSYRPAFEHVSVAVDQMLVALSTQAMLCRKGDEGEAKALSELCLTAQVLFHKFDSQLVLAANQKKIFTTIVDKSLTNLLNVRRKVSLCDKDIIGVSTVFQTITDIICHALFHADTVLEFTSVLKDASMDQTVNGNVKQTNYVVRLFDTLKTMINSNKDTDQMLDAADIVPVLFSAFLGAFRQKRNTTTSAMQDISRMAEFGIFINLLRILGDIKERAVSTYLHVLSLLLKELLQWNVYSSRNDDIAKSQQDVLNGIADDIVSYLDDPKRYNQGLVLDIADTLLQIDFSLVENRVQALWPVLVNSEEEAHESCLRFAKSILNTYSASRQLDLFIADLITHVGKIEFNSVYTILSKPMFTRDFLNEFSSLITKSMPTAQALGIFKNLQEHLVGEVVKPNSDTRASKKQKKSLTDGKQSSTATLITVYFCEFTNALRLNQHQLLSFGESALSVFFDFVKPSIHAWSETSDVAVEKTILPAMQIHSSLITTFFETYFCKLGAEDLAWLAKCYIKIFQDYVKKNTLGSRIVIAKATNVMLQHAYYSSLAQSPAEASQTIDLVNAVVDFCTEDSNWYEKTEWNGSVLALENLNMLKLACWKLLTDEWFESVVRFINGERAEKIANIIYSSLIKDHVLSTSVSAQILNKTLLRSANFYEAKCFKDCNVRAILNTFVKLFKTKLIKVNDGEMAKAAALMISTMDTTKPTSVDLKATKRLTEAIKREEDTMDEDTKASSTKNINKISTLMKLLLLFPIEYYEKNERPQVLYISTLIDIWSVTYVSADLLSRVKVSLMCRSLHMRFIDYFSINSILGLNFAMLDWLVTSYSQWTTMKESNDFKCLEQVSNHLDLNILRKVIMNAGAKAADEHSVKYLQDTLKHRVHDLDKSPSKASLNKLINLLCAINSILSGRKPSEADLSNIIYATDSMSLVSKYVIASLQNAKDSISDAISQTKADSSEMMSKNFDHVKCIFHLSRLLQEYAHIVGPAVDKVIEAETLSKALTGLASPLVQLLQATLTEDTKNDAILDMATEFIAAFCSILSRYQQVDTTKRVMAALWFVYSLVYKNGNQESLEVLSNAFASWIQSLSREQYTIVFEGFAEQIEKEASDCTDQHKEKNHLVFLALFSLLLSHCADAEKSRLRKQIPSTILYISTIASKTTSLEYILHMLKLLIQLTSDQSYHFKEYDASLLLACLLQIVEPTAAERFNGKMTRCIAESMFSDICSILSNFASQHKEQLVYMLPPFIALTQSLLHCFKSTHVSLVMTTNKKRKYNSEEENSKKRFASSRSISLLDEFAPLDDACAQRLARVFTTIPQKQVQHLTKHAKSAQSLHKIMSKHTHSILVEYFTIQSNPTMTVVNPSTKSILTNALYDILDMCSETDRNFILSCLDGPGKALFKSFYTNWKDNHKYTGQ